MDCPQCNGPIITQDEWMRGKCEKCRIKDDTCTVCGKLVEHGHVYVTANGYKETGRGHKSCLGGG